MADGDCEGWGTRLATRHRHCSLSHPRLPARTHASRLAPLRARRRVATVACTGTHTSAAAFRWVTAWSLACVASVVKWLGSSFGKAASTSIIIAIERR